METEPTGYVPLLYICGVLIVFFVLLCLFRDVVGKRGTCRLCFRIFAILAAGGFLALPGTGDLLKLLACIIICIFVVNLVMVLVADDEVAAPMRPAPNEQNRGMIVFRVLQRRREIAFR